MSAAFPPPRVVSNPCDTLPPTPPFFQIVFNMVRKETEHLYKSKGGQAWCFKKKTEHRMVLYVKGLSNEIFDLLFFLIIRTYLGH